MLKYFNASQKNYLKKLEIILERRKLIQKNQAIKIKKILSDVKKNGDSAILKYEKKFLNIKLKSKKIKFSNKDISKILKVVDKQLKKSIDVAFVRIKKFIYKL